MNPRVVITEWIEPDVVEFLGHSFEVVPNMTGGSLSRDEVLRRARDARAMMIFPPDVIDEEFLDWCPDLSIVAGVFDGCGQVDVQACTYRGVWVTNVPGLAIAPAAEGVRFAAALEAAANIFEAFLYERPKGAINAPVRRQRPKQPIYVPPASFS